MRGLIAPLERKNGWTPAEEAGHAGPDRIHRLLNRIEWDAEEALATAPEAAGRRHPSLPGEKLTARMVHALATEMMALNQQVAEIDKAIEAQVREHRDFDVITSMSSPWHAAVPTFSGHSPATDGPTNPRRPPHSRLDRPHQESVKPAPRSWTLGESSNRWSGSIAASRPRPHGTDRGHASGTRRGAVLARLPLRQRPDFLRRSAPPGDRMGLRHPRQVGVAGRPWRAPRSTPLARFLRWTIRPRGSGRAGVGVTRATTPQIRRAACRR